MHWRLPVLLSVAGIGVLLAPRAADACQDRVRAPTISAAEVAAHQHVYVVKVTKIVRGQPDSRYMPPFQFNGRIVRQLKGSLKPGARVHGRTSAGRFRSECPVRLARGETYLLFLNGTLGAKKGPLVLRRFGSRVIGSTGKAFRPAVARVQRLMKRRPTP